MGVFEIISFLVLIAFATSVAFATAIPSNDPPLTKRDPNCDTGPGWAPVKVVGATGDSDAQCETQFGRDYSPVKSIEVWRRSGHHGSRIAGLQFTYASEAVSPVYGHQDSGRYPSTTLSLDAGEFIKNAILYADHHEEWLGHIHMETSNGQIFDAGRDAARLKPRGLEVGSGFLLGATITVEPSDKGDGDDVKNIGFLFLGPTIDHIAINEVNYTDDPRGSKAGIDPKQFDIGKWYNHGPNSVAYGNTIMQSVTSSHSFKQSTTFTWGAKFSVLIEADVFDVEKSTFGVEVSWTGSHETGTSVTKSVATSIACAASGSLKVGQAVSVTGSYHTGTKALEYDSTVIVYLEDGSDYRYSEKGRLENSAYTECTILWEEIKDFQQIIDEIDEGKGKDSQV